MNQDTREAERRSRRRDEMNHQDIPEYLQVLPLSVLRVIALVSLVLALGLTMLGIVAPSRFENDIARFMLCLAVATLLALFFFIFYPQKIELNLPLVIGKSIRLVGPVALWVGVLLFLWQFMPSPVYGKVYEIWANGQRGGMYFGDKSTTFLTVKAGKPPEHYLIGQNDGTRTLFGIYVLFPKNVQEIEATLHHEGWSRDLPITLKRNDEGMIDVSAVQEGDHR